MTSLNRLPLIFFLFIIGCGQTEELRKYLMSHNAAYQIYAINKIIREKAGGTELIGPLSVCMESSEPDVSALAAKALGTFGEPAIPILSRKLKNDDPEIRWRAALGLFEAGIAARSAAPELIAALKDEDPVVKQYSAMAIGKAKIREAIPELKRCLKDEDPSVRQAASIALLSLGIINRHVPTIKRIERKSTPMGRAKIKSPGSNRNIPSLRRNQNAP